MLEQLAPKYADVCFIALHYEDAEMEHAGVPAVLAYKDGEQFASLTPLRETFTVVGDDYTSLEAALTKYGFPSYLMVGIAHIGNRHSIL